MKASTKRITGAIVCAAATVGMAYFATSAFGQNGAQRNGGGLPDLVGGLKQIDGCLGVEAGQMNSGKRSILAWFEDKDAVIRWYNSRMHQGAMQMFAGAGVDYSEKKPLAHVPDGTGPILVIATLKMAAENQVKASQGMPLEMISIELYQPLPGGAFANARLAPDSVKVPHMADYTQ